VFQDTSLTDLAKDHLVLSVVVLLVLLRIGLHSIRFALKLFAQFLADVSEEVGALIEAVEKLTTSIRALMDRLAVLRKTVFGEGRVAHFALSLLIVLSLLAVFAFGVKAGRGETAKHPTAPPPAFIDIGRAGGGAAADANRENRTSTNKNTGGVTVDTQPRDSTTSYPSEANVAVRPSPHAEIAGPSGQVTIATDEPEH
jgi:hypothetical protein